MVHVSGERFKWGGKKSELIHKSFLLDTLPILAPCDGSLRVFKVENYAKIQTEFREYCDRYF